MEQLAILANRFAGTDIGLAFFYEACFRSTGERFSVSTNCPAFTAALRYCGSNKER
jgi:hypothetical protein